MTTSLTSWLDGLSSVQLALVCCLFFIAITLMGIVLIHPLMTRLIHGERQANDVVIFVAANYGLIFAVLLGLLTGPQPFQSVYDLVMKWDLVKRFLWAIGALIIILAASQSLS